MLRFGGARGQGARSRFRFEREDTLPRLTMELPCSAVLFDLDGVLVDSAPLVERLWREWATAHGLAVQGVLAVAHGWRTIDTIRAVAPDLDADAEAAAFEAREVLESPSVTAQPGARELLDPLPPARWGVVTSGTRELAAARFAATGLPRPRILVTADDVAEGKPDPEGYLCGAEHLGVHPSEIVVMEDSPTGIEAACAAAMRTIGVIGTHRPEELASADVRVRGLRDIRVDLAAPTSALRLLIDVPS